VFAAGRLIFGGLLVISPSIRSRRSVFKAESFSFEMSLQLNVRVDLAFGFTRGSAI
jgi:hypothetical protein